MQGRIFRAVDVASLNDIETEAYRRLVQRVHVLMAINLSFGVLASLVSLVGVLRFELGQPGLIAIGTIMLYTSYVVVHHWLMRRGYPLLGTLINLILAMIAISIGVHLTGFAFSVSMLYLVLILAAGLVLEHRQSVVFITALSVISYSTLAGLELSGLWPPARGPESTPGPTLSLTTIIIVLTGLVGGAAVVLSFLRDKEAITQRLIAARELSARRASELEETGQELQESLERYKRLLETVWELSAPIVPVLEGVIVLPVVGYVDQERACRIMDSLLQGIARHRARIVLVDLTGLANVDQVVATCLLETVRTVRLLGAEVMLTGVQVEAAQTLAELGVDWREVPTRPDLRSGVEYALRTRRTVTREL